MFTTTIRGAIAGMLLALAPISGANAAIVTDVASPALFEAPNATELANITDLLLNGIGLDAGSIVNPLRSAPTNDSNLGLDADEPGTAFEDAESLEIGIIRLPTPSYSCPAATPVTITISPWSLTLLGANPSVPDQGAGGSLIMDERDLTSSAPATDATLGGSDTPAAIGLSTIMAARSFVGTFADLPHLTYMTGIASAKVNNGVVFQLGFRSTLPSLTLEYDNAACTAVSANAGAPPQAVPGLGFTHLLALILLLPLVALKGRRRRAENPRR